MNPLFLKAYQEAFGNFKAVMNGLSNSYIHCKSIGLKDNYDFPETEAYDALIIKLTRNSDVFFQQILKGYFKLKEEDNLFFIDRINLLVKLRIISDSDKLM